MNDIEWLVDYFIECPEFNDLAMKNGLGIRRETCKCCGRTMAVPAELHEYEGYICVQCTDDAIHDYVERQA